MSSLSINSVKSSVSSDASFVTEVPAKRSNYLCPKCNRKYDFQVRNGHYMGRVPLILPCSHNICEECVRATVNLSHSITCIECHESIPVPDKSKIQLYFQVNLHLLGDLYYSKVPSNNESIGLQMRPTGMRYRDRLNSKLEEPDENYAAYISTFINQKECVQKCSQLICREEATLNCNECNEVFCDSCSNNLHRSARGLQKHKILPVSSLVVPELSNKCLDHVNQAIEFNCNTCDKLLCCYCVLQNHNDHKFVMLSNLDEAEHSNLEILVKSVEDRLKKFIMSHKKVENEICNNKRINFNKGTTVELEVAKCFANLHGKLQVLEKKILCKIHESRSRNVTTLKNIKEDLSANVRTTLALLKSAKNINNPDIKLNVPVLFQRLNNVLANPCYLLGESNNSDNICFHFDDTCLDFEESFIVTENTESEAFSLVSEDQLPVGYDTTLPESLAKINFDDISKRDNFRTASTSIAEVSSPTPAENLSRQYSATKRREIKTTRKSLAEINYAGIIPLKRHAQESCMVSHIDSPESFYVQLLKNQNAFESFSKDIDYFVKTAPFVEKPEINALYFVKYIVKNKRPEWSRGRVLEIKKDSHGEDVYEVIFIDFGNSKYVGSKMIKQMPAEFVRPRPFALHCKLDNTYPLTTDWDARSMKLMAEIVNNNSCLIRVQRVSGGITEVELYVNSGGTMASVRDALIFIGHAKPSLEEEPQVTRSEVMPMITSRNLAINTENFKKERVLDVLITHIVNPDNIYVQQICLLPKLNEINNSMYEYYTEKEKYAGAHTGSLSIYAPKTNMIVALQTKDYNTCHWYRGIITDVLNGEGLVEVFLVDYGKTKSAVYTQLRQLPDRFRQISCLAVKVKLVDIIPIDGKTWSKESISYLETLSDSKERIKLTVAKVTKDIEVILFETYPDFDVCLNALMVKDGFAQSTGELSTKIQWLKEGKNERKHLEEPLSLINTSINSDEGEEESDDDEATTVPKKYVRILSVKNPGLIYVGIEDKEAKDKQMKLFFDIQDFYNTKHKILKRDIAVNDACVVYHRAKNEYYRALVMEKTEEDSFKVMLRDIVEEVNVHSNDIYILEPTFKIISEGAVRCHLNNIIPAGDPNKWSSTSTDFLNDVFLKGSILMAKNGLVEKERKSLPVIMWYTEFKPGSALEPSKTILHNINKLLVKRGLALNDKVLTTDMILSSINVESTESTNILSSIDEKPKASSKEEKSTEAVLGKSLDSKGAPSALSFNWLPPEPFTMTKFDAMATYIDNFANIHLHELEHHEALQDMETTMKEIFDNVPVEPLDTVWVPGQVCTVRYHLTNCWYRGKIESVVGEIINVLLVDFGNVEECQFNDLRTQIAFKNVPIFAKKIHLHKVICKSDVWWTSDLDELHTTLVDKRISVTLKGDIGLASVPAKVYIGGVDVNKEIVNLSKNLNYGYNKIAEVEEGPAIVIENEFYDNDANIVIEAVNLYEHAILPESYIGKKLRVCIVSVYEYNIFIFELINDTKIMDKGNLFEEISQDIKLNGHKQPPLQNIEEGQSCIAVFSEDKQYYRALTEGKEVDGSVFVWFVDFGNFDVVPVESVRQIQPKWLELPILQYKGEVPDLLCLFPDGEKHTLLIERLGKLCNTEQDAEIISVDPLQFRLYNAQGDLSYQSLIDDGFLAIDK